MVEGESLRFCQKCVPLARYYHSISLGPAASISSRARHFASASTVLHMRVLVWDCAMGQHALSSYPNLMIIAYTRAQST